MIVKYLNNDVWGYIDNVTQAAVKGFDPQEYIEQYNSKVEKGREDVASYMNGETLPSDIAMSNKIFLIATENIEIENAENVHRENLISCFEGMELMPSKIILIYLENNKEYDALVLVTNQVVYLMNDKGQTIERLS